MSTNTRKIAVIGGGVTGLSTAWQLSRVGHKVSVYERDQFGQAASYAGAGMLAPQAEAKFEEEDLMKLGQLSLGWYSEFLSQLAFDGGDDIDFDECGTVLVGINRDDTDQLKRLFRFRESLNLKIEWLTGSEARDKIPALSPRVTAGMWLPLDAQIDHHHLLESLLVVLRKQGQSLYEKSQVTDIKNRSDGAWEVQVNQDQKEAHDGVVIASGAWSKMFQKTTQSYDFGLRPVKGELLALSQNDSLPLETMVRTPRAYMVPKGDGSLLIGATSYEQGFDHRPSAGGVKDLLQFGYEALPAIYDLPLQAIRVGLRPATEDNSPLIGESQPGLYWATGHYRHGFLLSPLTAYTIKALVGGDDIDPLTQKFTPARFQKAVT